jgi:hypothetical protein
MYTDADKIKALTAWHESEKKEIAELKAQVASLTAAKDVLTSQYDALQVESIRADSRRQAERKAYEKQIEATIRAEYEYAETLAVEQLRAQAAEIHELKMRLEILDEG